jgi:phosphoglycerate dehydrogenase-like enzyme
MAGRSARQGLVALCGPPMTGGFLRQLTDELQARGVNCLLNLDSLDALSADERFRDVRVLVLLVFPCTGEVMDRAPSLRAIIVPSLGYEGIDVEAAARRGVLVANGLVSENFDTVAEAAFLFMLMALYDVHAAERRLREGVRRSGPPTARMLRGKTVGVIGYGNIARAFIRRLRNWGTSVLVHSRSRREGAVPDADAVFVELDELLRRSDVVVPLTPLNPTTQHLLDRARLMAMREGAILVNLSRGGVIEEAALADPAVAGRLRTLALDVFEEEPLPMASPLRDLPNTILTGHDIAQTVENIEALRRKAIDNVLVALAGGTPDTTLNA